VALLGGARLGGGVARRAGGGSAPAHGRRRGNGGLPARRRRRGLTATGERRAARDGIRPGVGGFGQRRSGRRRERGEQSGRRRRARGSREACGAGEATVGGERREAAVGRGAGEARQMSGCVARCPDSGFKLRRGARRLTGGARCQ
jgi:hypothetical protein